MGWNDNKFVEFSIFIFIFVQGKKVCGENWKLPDPIQGNMNFESTYQSLNKTNKQQQQQN